MTERVKEESFQPGAARHGNFINYYQFNPPENRLQVIPTDLLSQLGLHESVGLDVGCNAGELTIALYKHLTMNSSATTSLSLLGVDLDPVLIERSKETNPFPNHISYQQLDIMDDSCIEALQAYLQGFQKNEFDIIFCFSITMWIHLNHGDIGLWKFLRIVSQGTKYLLMEPQPWKCYKAAVRRMKRLKSEQFSQFDSLKYRSTVDELIINFLCAQCGMQCVQCFGKSAWGRPLYLLRKETK